MIAMYGGVFRSEAEADECERYWDVALASVCADAADLAFFVIRFGDSFG